MDRYDVIIAGAGLGGLCAAAGLRGTGLRTLVVERDAGLVSRPQGYRININPAGDKALGACLPPSHYELYRDTSHRQIDPSVDIFAPDLTLRFHREAEAAQAGPPPAAVDRGVLRAILLDVARDVRFGAEVIGASSFEDRVEVRLGDGSLLEADLLVAADGANSTLRKCVLPGHEPVELPTAGIYGRAALDPLAMTWLPRGVLEQRFVGVADRAGNTLALGAWYPRRDLVEASRLRVPGLQLPAADPYVMWVLLCPAAIMIGPECGPEALWRFALSAVSGWHPAAIRFVQEAIVPDTFRIVLRSVASVPEWNSARITFLGDSIHAMSPAGGEGANTAFADAASLVSCLRENGLQGLPAYEQDLRRRATLALDRSANYGRSAAQEVSTHV